MIYKKPALNNYLLYRKSVLKNSNNDSLVEYFTFLYESCIKVQK